MYWQFVSSAPFPSISLVPGQVESIQRKKGGNRANKQNDKTLLRWHFSCSCSIYIEHHAGHYVEQALIKGKLNEIYMEVKRT